MNLNVLEALIRLFEDDFATTIGLLKMEVHEIQVQ